MLGDLKDARWMYLKAALFVAICAVSSVLLLIESPRWSTALLIALLVWSSARAYYFAFYVIERYIDPSFKFDGLISAARHIWRIRGDR